MGGKEMDLMRRIIRKLLGRLKKDAGFTLMEVMAVVAITGTLAAVIVPVAIDQIEQARLARAAQDIDAINSALQAFFRDTGEWPDRTAVNLPDGISILRSGRPETPNTFPGSDTGAGFGEDPDVGSTDWSVSGGQIDEMVNHLTLDNPLGNSTSGQPSGIYRQANVNWNGPYLPQIFNDPWGRNYLVYTNAYTTPSVGSNDVYVWIISAGPNETLETDVSSPVLNNKPVSGQNFSSISDDIGLMVFRSREALPGVE